MNRQTVFVIALVALSLRLLYLAVVFDGPASLRAPDSLDYENTAAGLLATGRMVTIAADGTTHPNTERAPGYIGFLAAVRLVLGDAPLYAVLVQILLDTVTCLLVAWLAGFLNPRLALLAGVLAATNLDMIVHAATILGDSLFLLPLVAGMIAVARYQRRQSFANAVAAGLLFGIAWLVRPALIYFLPVLVAVFIVAAWRGRRPILPALGEITALVAAVMLLVGPLYYRNVREYGALAMTSQTGTHALNWVAALTYEYAKGMPRSEALAEMDSRLKADLAARGRTALPKNPFAASAEMQAVARKAMWDIGIGAWIKAWATGAAINLSAPAIVAAPPVRAMTRPSFYATPGVTVANKIWTYLAADPLFTLVILPAGALTVLCRLLSLGAVVQMRGRLAPAPTWFLIAVAVYFLAITGPVTGVKYRLPLEPTLDILLAAALVWLFDFWFQRGPRRARGRASQA